MPEIFLKTEKCQKSQYGNRYFKRIYEKCFVLDDKRLKYLFSSLKKFKIRYAMLFVKNCSKVDCAGQITRV